MKPIIDNDLKKIYIKNDYYIEQITKTNAKILAGDTTIPVINSAGFNDDDYIIIENLGKERAELTQINSVSNNILYTNPIIFDHESKTNVFKASYNFINIYENNTLIGTLSIQPDYYSVLNYDINQGSNYAISYYNTAKNKETEKGETVKGSNNLLCSISDLQKYEDANQFIDRIIDKIDLASTEIRNKFIAQKQSIDDLANRELLRLPTALLALYYLFTELIKTKDDLPSLKAEKYKTLYESKITEIAQVINQTETQVNFFGQSIITR